MHIDCKSEKDSRILGSMQQFLAAFSTLFPLSIAARMWYVMHGVIWVYCAHDVRRFFLCFGPSRPMEKRCVKIVRSVFAGGYSQALETAGETPWGVPNQFEKRIKLKEL